VLGKAGGVTLMSSLQAAWPSEAALAVVVLVVAAAVEPGPVSPKVEGGPPPPLESRGVLAALACPLANH
jgi:hypothetical protein